MVPGDTVLDTARTDASNGKPANLRKAAKHWPWPVSKHHETIIEQIEARIA